MNYKLIALDMDGTLLNRNGEISAANREAIQEAAANGVYVILATGRSIRQVIPYVEQLNLNVPLIVNNGSEVWRTPDRLLARHLLRSVYVEKILSFVKQYGDDVSYWGIRFAERSAQTIGRKMFIRNNGFSLLSKQKMNLV